jgi:hypothetical protein
LGKEEEDGMDRVGCMENMEGILIWREEKLVGIEIFG